MIPTYVINLDRRPDRMAFMQPQLDRLGLRWERVAAADARDVPDAAIAREVRLTGHRISMGRGSMCCAITNFDIWRRILAEGHRAALILQDDTALAPDLARLTEDIGWLPPEIGVVQFERFGRRGSARLVGPALAEPVPGVTVHRLLSRTGGAGAYLITAEAAARALTDKPLLNMPIDHFLFSPNVSPLFRGLGVAVTLPGLAVQRMDDIASDLSAERAARSRQRGVGARLSRLWSEVNRVPQQLAAMAGGARWRPFDLHPSLRTAPDR
jgi:glycosyl transferase, family 25